MSTFDAIEAEALRIMEDCEYSSKAHFEAAGAWRHAHLWLGIPIAVLAGVAGVSALANKPILAAVVAFLVAGLTAVMTFLNPERRAAQHQASGNQYLALKNRTRIFKTVDLSSMDGAVTGVAALKELGNQRDELNESSPGIPRWAFERARQGIEEGEALHRVDAAT